MVRGCQVAGLWDEQMLYAAAHQDLLKDVHLLVGTPEHLARVATSGNLRLHQLQAPCRRGGGRAWPSRCEGLLLACGRRSSLTRRTCACRWRRRAVHHHQCHCTAITTAAAAAAAAAAATTTARPLPAPRHSAHSHRPPRQATSQLMRRLEEACGAFAVPRPQLLLAGASISASHVEQAAVRYISPSLPLSPHISRRAGRPSASEPPSPPPSLHLRLRADA